MRAHSIAFTICLAMSLALVGCQPVAGPTAADGTTSRVALINTFCPIEGGPVDESVSVDWNGKQVGFCCSDCIPTWNALSEEEKEVKLTESADADAPNEHADHAHHVE